MISNGSVPQPCPRDFAAYARAVVGGPPGGHADPGMRFASGGADAVTLPTLTAAP